MQNRPRGYAAVNGSGSLFGRNFSTKNTKKKLHGFWSCLTDLCPKSAILGVLLKGGGVPTPFRRFAFSVLFLALLSQFLMDLDKPSINRSSKVSSIQECQKS